MKDDELRDDESDGPGLEHSDADLDALCEKWVYWCHEQRLHAPVSPLRAVIARQGGGTRPIVRLVDEAIPAASLLALHIAYTCQPDSLDKQVFDLYYVARVKPIKTAAAALGIGRRHFYRVLFEFRQRLGMTARAFERNGASTVAALHTSLPVVNDESVPQTEHKLGNHE